MSKQDDRYDVFYFLGVASHALHQWVRAPPISTCSVLHVTSNSRTNIENEHFFFSWLIYRIIHTIYKCIKKITKSNWIEHAKAMVQENDLLWEVKSKCERAKLRKVKIYYGRSYEHKWNFSSLKHTKRYLDDNFRVSFFCSLVAYRLGEIVTFNLVWPMAAFPFSTHSISIPS